MTTLEITPQTSPDVDPIVVETHAANMYIVMPVPKSIEQSAR